MLSQYITIAYRHLAKDKLYSLFLILGLGIGLGIFLLCFKMFLYGTTPDSYLQDIERIYCIVQKYQLQNGEEKHFAYVPFPLAMTLKNEIPAVEQTTRIFQSGRMALEYGQKKFYENSIYFVDPNFLEFFTFDVLSGNRETMLTQPNSIVLTHATALKYFGQENPIGKLLTLNNKQAVVVTGIVENLSGYPSTSSMRYDFLVSMETARMLYGSSLEQWNNARYTGFIKLRPSSGPSDLENQMQSILQRYYPVSPESPKKIYLYPMKGIVFSAPHIEKYSGNNTFTVFIIFLVMGFLFLSIVTINYINLSTAKYLDRLKEVGMRKVVGAQKFDIIKQFLGESIFLSVLSIPLAIAIYNLAGSAIIGRVGFDFDWTFWKDIRLVFFLIGASILTGIVAGSYPALYASSFQPMRMLKDTSGPKTGRGRLRNVLVVLQFFVSIVFIVMTIVWRRQAEYVAHVDMGYAKKGVIAIPLQDETKGIFSLLKEKIQSHSDVLAVSASQRLPGNWMGTKTLITENVPSNGITGYAHNVDYNFIETAGLQLLHGRSFARDYHDENSLIINKLLAERMGWKDPVGKSLIVDDKQCTVIGVVDNYRFEVIRENLKPTFLRLEQKDLNYLLVNVSNVQNVLKVKQFIREQWNQLVPNEPFDAFTLDEDFQERHFQATTVLSEIFGVLGGIALLFSALGLLGLASFLLRKRTKEIGLRKVLGATTSDIFLLLGMKFMKLVLLSNIIALPIAYLAAHSLLESSFSVRVPIQADVFIWAIVITTLIAFIAVLSQTMRAAQKNPAEALRYE
jgi:putative ABC transport system permease protein